LLVASLPDLQRSRFVAVGAAEGIPQQDRQGQAQTVAAKEFSDMLAFRAIPVGQNGSDAKWAIRPLRDQPLEEDHHYAKRAQRHGNERKWIVMDEDRIDQDTPGSRHQNTLETQQERNHSEPENRGF
jgi:hypothetical protein